MESINLGRLTKKRVASYIRPKVAAHLRTNELLPVVGTYNTRPRPSATVPNSTNVKHITPSIIRLV